MSKFENLYDQVMICCDLRGNNCSWCPRASYGRPTEQCRESLLREVFTEYGKTLERLKKYENLD
jgi:hypothetical protein